MRCALSTVDCNFLPVDVVQSADLHSLRPGNRTGWAAG